jgi:nicotinate-nucleotide pyrophosphorylase (carboxylating)
VEEREKRLGDLVRAALAEDAARKDVTTRLLVDASRLGDASIRAEGPGVISGQKAALETFRALDPSIAYSATTPDGSSVQRGTVVARVYGHMRAILSAERTALNFLRHLSGVATLTAAYVAKVKETGILILDTRKTTPGLRALEKEAVVHGGGRNHRVDLASMILVKENHIASSGGLAAAVAKLGAGHLASAEIEVTSLEEFRALRDTPPRRIMLDNFEPEAVAEAVAEMNGWTTVSEIEVSGGVNLENVVSYAIAGVGYISTGAITSGAPPLDMSLDLEGIDRG